MSNYIHPSAVIYDCVTLEEDVYIGANCIIGAPAESKGHWGSKPEYGVVIKSGTIINGACTVDAGTVRDTIIGQNCFLMKQTHIGHDAILQDGVTVSPHASIGGHCVIGHGSNLGMGCSIHQRVNVPADCMIGMNATITKKTQIYKNSVMVGNPAFFLRWNNRK